MSTALSRRYGDLLGWLMGYTRLGTFDQRLHPTRTRASLPWHILNLVRGVFGGLLDTEVAHASLSRAQSEISWSLSRFRLVLL